MKHIVQCKLIFLSINLAFKCYTSNPDGFYSRIISECDQDLWFQYTISLEPAPVSDHVSCCSRVYDYLRFCFVWWLRHNVGMNPFCEGTRYKGTCGCSTSSFFIFPSVLLSSPPFSVP